MFRLSSYIDQQLNLDTAKAVMRTLGINLTTAGVVGLFITNIDSWSQVTILGVISVLAIGLLLILLGLRGGTNHG
jgi:hypothetical protein